MAKKTLSNVAKTVQKGGLHKSLGVPQGKKLTQKQIEKAEKSTNPRTRKQANLAETFAKYRKGGN